MTLGRALARLRADFHLTPGTVADCAGLTETQLLALEADAWDPDPATLLRVIECYLTSERDQALLVVGVGLRDAYAEAQAETVH